MSRHSRSLSMPNRSFVARFGIPSLDSILNGGIPLGSLVLIETSETTEHLFTKAYLGEGAVGRDHLFVYSESKQESIIGKVKRIGNLSVRGSTTIRYETFVQNSSISEPYTIDLQSAEQDYQDCKHSVVDCSMDDLYHNLWVKIKNDVKDANFCSVSRILVSNFLGISWPHQSLSEIFQFLSSIKTLLRSKNSVCLLTVPLKSLSKSLQEMLIRSSDIVIQSNSNSILIKKVPKSVHLQDQKFSIINENGLTTLEPVN